jgi:septal ring factor EnvC (AmiA/AmiB activator)
MKNTITKMMSICLVAVLLTSCVSKKRYVFQRDKATQAEKDNMALNGRINKLQDTVHMLHGKLNSLSSANPSTENELNRTNSELYKTNSELNMTKEQIDAVNSARVAEETQYYAQMRTIQQGYIDFTQQQYDKQLAMQRANNAAPSSGSALSTARHTSSRMRPAFSLPQP